MELRPLKKAEYPLLKEFLYLALYVHVGEDPFPRSILDKPELVIYYQEFGKKDDYAIAAVDGEKVIGIAWTRIMHDYGYVDDETPSLSIALLPEWRSKGIGRSMMERLLEDLRKRGYRKVSLSSQKENRSCNLYFSLGFTVQREDDEEFVMVKTL